MKPAWIILSDSAKQVTQEHADREIKRRRELLEQPPSLDKVKNAVEFLRPKLYKPLPGSILAEVDKRLELIELSGEVIRLEGMLQELKKSKEYSPGELLGLSAKINLLKSLVKNKMSS